MIFRVFLLLSAVSALGSCSLLDIIPPGGFPEYQSRGAPKTRLAPQSEFEFHHNPELLTDNWDATLPNGE